MAKQHRPNDIDDVAQQFSNALPFCYAHLAGKCRRRIMLQSFDEDVVNLQCPDNCCDICQQELGTLIDRNQELSILLKAINDLPKMGEVKVTECIRGGQISWKDITKHDDSAYGKSPPGLSKEWWRGFIRQCSSAGYISRIIKSVTYGQTVQGAYASLKPTEKGRSVVLNKKPVLFPEVLEGSDSFLKVRKQSGHVQEAADKELPIKKRCGKGKHMLPILKDLLANKENQIELTECDKERYEYPGSHNSISGNVLYFTSDVTKLPHYSEEHFLWTDIQLGKTGTSRNKATVTIDGKSQDVTYWMSKCKGVKKCESCDHVVSNSFVKNNCKMHPKAALCQSEDCPVEFIYVFPQSTDDKRRWIGGIIRSPNICPQKNLHSHPVSCSLNHKLPKKICSDLEKTVYRRQSLLNNMSDCVWSGNWI